MTPVRSHLAAVSAYDARQLNLAAVLESIRDHPGVSRSEIRATMPFSLQTMSNIVQELLDMNLVTEDERPKSGKRGSPHRALGIRAEAGFALGVQVRWNSCVLVLMDLSLSAIDSQTCAIDVQDADIPTHVAALASLIRDFLGRHPEKDVWGIGLAGPLAIENPATGAYRQFVERGLNIGWFRATPFQEGLQEALGLPVRILNNPQASALAQSTLLPAEARFAYILVGMGLGASFVCARAVSRDVWPHGGELGHVLHRDAPMNATLSARSLARSLGLDPNPEQLERELVDINDSDPGAFDPWIGQTVPILRSLVNFVEAALWPDGIVLGGFMPAGLLQRLAVAASPLNVSVVPPDDEPSRIMPRLSVAQRDAASIAFGAAINVLSYRQNNSLPTILAKRRVPR